MANEVSLDLNDELFNRKLDAAEARVKNLRAELQSLTMGDPGSNAQFRSTANNLAGAESAVANLKGSSSGVAPSSGTIATPGGAGPASPQMRAVMNQYPGLSAAAYQQMAQQLGIPQAAPATVAPAASTNPNVVSMVVQAVQSAQGGSERTLQFQRYGPQMGGGYNFPPLPGAGDVSGMFTPGTGAGNLYDPNRTMSFPAPMAAPAAGMPWWNRLGGRFSPGAAAMGGLYAVSQGFDISANMTRTGQVQPSAIGSVAGTLIGGGIGMAFGGPAGMVAGGILGGSVGGWLSAPIDRGYAIASSFIPGIGLLGGAHSGAMGALDTWANSTAAQLNNMPRTQGMQNITAASLGAGYSTMVNALLGSGIDPFGFTGSGLPGAPGIPGTPGRYPFGRPGDYGQRTLRNNNLFDGVGQAAMDAIRQKAFVPGTAGTPDIPYAGDETLPQAISRRIHTTYPDDAAAQAVIKTIAPIWHAAPYTRGNAADIIAQYGSAAYTQYEQSRFDRPHPALTTLAAGEYEAQLQGTRRSIEIGGLQSRGSGGAVAAGYLARMNAIQVVPGGEDSLAFAGARAGYRGAQLTEFGQRLTTQYDIPLVQAQTNIARASIMPYRPGEVIGLKLSAARTELNEASDINNFIQRQKARGLLTEDEELALRQKASGAAMSAYAAVGEAASGGPDWVGAMSVNRTSGFRRFSPVQLAARYMNPYAPFRRDYGFSGGGAEQQNNDFWESFGIPTGPTSRTAGVNAGPNSDRLAAAMERLAGVMERSMMGGRGNTNNLPPDGGGLRSGSQMPGN